MVNYKKIAQDFAEDIISTQPNFWDNPNGPYTYTCPFCLNQVYDKSWIGDIEHDKNCPYEKASKFLRELDSEEER